MGYPGCVYMGNNFIERVGGEKYVIATENCLCDMISFTQNYVCEEMRKKATHKTRMS